VHCTFSLLTVNIGTQPVMSTDETVWSCPDWPPATHSVWTA